MVFVVAEGRRRVSVVQQDGSLGVVMATYCQHQSRVAETVSLIYRQRTYSTHAT